ncbi:hypothetical protein [Pseudonocardia sp. NPDC046786]|uniref:hypothetical protein n=1 Tax=Pseudonocardia sp. NPDC046786 TaxID=3155471 RepID=UPI0033C865A0
MPTPRRRPAGGIRRPQVAGRPRTARPGSEHDEDGEPGGLALDDRAADTAPAAPTAPARPADTGPGPGGPGSRAAEGSSTTRGTAGPGSTGPADTADDPPASRARGRAAALLTAPATSRGAAALLAVTVLLTAAAVFFGVSWYRTAFTGSAGNTALTDVGATAQVSEQVTEAVTKVYSFDHARLQQAEDDARAVITPEFQPEFDRIFGSVRELAPQQNAVVTATIPKSAVARIDGDDASVYVFVNQVIRREDDAGVPQEGAAAARLRVDAQFVDGRWKISAMNPA